MASFLDWTLMALAGLTIPSFVATMTLFARGNWHLGKRMLATTATIGFLLAVTIIVWWFTHG